MNPELEEAEKKLRDGIIAYVRAAYKTVGSVNIAVMMMGEKIMSIGESVTEADFEGLDDNEVAKNNGTQADKKGR